MGRIEAAEKRWQVIRHRGRLKNHQRIGEISNIEIALAGGVDTLRLPVDRVVDCSGPRSALSEIDSPLLRQLLASGQIRADPLGLGLDVTDDGSVVNAGGKSGALYAIGPVTKGAFWEITAVPDLRNACAALAKVLLARQAPQAEASSARKAWIAA